jgi:predicted transcriptional regulator
MKTAISLTDELFEQAEGAALRLRISRSELYARALAEFLKRQDSNAVTERLNDIYSKQPATVDPAFLAAQMHTLEKDAW